MLWSRVSQFPERNPKLLDAFHTGDSCRQLWAQQPRIGGFVCQTAKLRVAD